MGILHRAPLVAVSLALVAGLASMAVLPYFGRADDDNDNSSQKKTTDTGAPSKPAIQQGIVPAGGVAPDLKIEYAGFNTPGNTQLIKFKITNVGNGPSLETVARVLTSTPEPTPFLRELYVKPLAPGESVDVVYSLADTCMRHLVKALVNAPQDSNSANNMVEAQVCPAPPPIVPESPPIGDPTVDYGACAICNLPPEPLQLGEHKDGGKHPAVEVGANVFRPHGIVRTSKGPLGDIADECGLHGLNHEIHVGFLFDGGAFCDQNLVVQLILDFDLQWLRGIEKKLIYRADLLYEEGPRTVTGDSSTCVGRAGQAPANWPEIVTRTSSPDSLRPTLLTTQDIAGDRVPGGWEVTEELRSAANPSLASQWHGLVLHGLDENLDADANNSICMSQINHARLRLQYVVL